jgi:ATP-dependent DNA ligase
MPVMASDIVMLANEFDKHSAAFKKWWRGSVENIRGFIVQPKFDGVFCAIGGSLVTGGTCAITRTGELVRSVDASKWLVPGHVVFGELWKSGVSFPEISGRARSHSPQDLDFVPFDMVTQYEFSHGFSKTPYARRLISLGGMLRVPPADRVRLDLHESYGSSARWYVDFGGFDGIILRDPLGMWSRGRSRNGEIVKVKVVNSLDLRIVGATAEIRPTKLGGYLTVDYRGTWTDVGSGLTQDMLRGIQDGTARFIGSIAEVEYLGITADGKLREPRLKGIRHDKAHADG